jgi:hypothetical protein
MGLLLSAPSTPGIAVNDPLVLGPIAAFIFVVFVSETVVSGKAYKREVEENKRLRELIERVVPLAEKMVSATQQIIEVTQEATRIMADVVTLVATRDDPRRRPADAAVHAQHAPYRRRDRASGQRSPDA